MGLRELKKEEHNIKLMIDDHPEAIILELPMKNILK